MTYHRLVNTTPNPKATKKSNGELVGPVPLLPPELVVGPGGADDVEVAEDMVRAVVVIVSDGKTCVTVVSQRGQGYDICARVIIAVIA